ncbi:hypothetical protein GCM10022224_090610 [Nonomuraea antimicrobica]|uniref:Resolvase, N terminal domain n=2 Tax=Nonomuraea antimicrobica TaxID=561173 RepID=A0ABP7DW92_9ACTN
MDIHAVREWCQARGVVLRVLSGPLSNFHDLAADDATTATALIINVITAVGQFQRDLRNELTLKGSLRPKPKAATVAGHPHSPEAGLRKCGRRSVTRAPRSRVSRVSAG